MIEGTDVICLASSHWDSRSWVNCQHIMSRLAPANRVLYVEPLSLRMPGAGRRDLKKAAYRLSSWRKGARKVRENLWVLSPVMVPAHRYGAVRRLNRGLVLSSIRRAAGRAGFVDPIVWAFLPTAAGLAGRLGERLLIYHCVDNYSANPGADTMAIEKMERVMLERADLVFATSPALYEKCSRSNPSTVYLPNVADADHFSRALSGGLEAPADLAALPSPRVGFIGNLAAYKVDIELAAGAARRMPEVSFVFIGPVGAGDPSTDTSPLQGLENVHLLGEKDYDELPAYLSGMDACIIPFRSNETTRGVFPMKFFEYLAAGRPVVATGLPALAEYSEYCYIAAGVDEFTRMLGEALAEDDQDAVRGRRRVAEAHSWTSRMETLSRRIEEKDADGPRPER